MPRWNTGEPVGTPVRGNEVKVISAGSTLRVLVRADDEDTMCKVWHYGYFCTDS